MRRLTRAGRGKGTRAEVNPAACSMRVGLAPKRMAIKGAVTPVEVPLNSNTERAYCGGSQKEDAHSATGRAKSFTAPIAPTSRVSPGPRRARVWKSTPRKLKKSWAIISSTVQGVTINPNSGHSTPTASPPRDRTSSITSRILISRPLPPQNVQTLYLVFDSAWNRAGDLECAESAGEVLRPGGWR